MCLIKSGSYQSWDAQSLTMTDSLLTSRDEEELISIAYAHAVAARAGYVTAAYAKDNDGIDMRIQAGGLMRPGIDLQLKATINLNAAADGSYRFPLPVRNYNLLRIPTQTPRLLVVLDLPSDREQWMTITDDSLVIRHRAYWVNLLGCAETSNTHSVTVQIPSQNVFGVQSLRELMEQSRQGSLQ